MVHRKCAITNEYGKQLRDSVKISQIISIAIESSGRGHDKSYVVTSKKV